MAAFTSDAMAADNFVFKPQFVFQRQTFCKHKCCRLAHKADIFYFR